MIRRNSFRAGSSSGLGSTQKITVRLLDDNEVLQLDFQTQQKAQSLMDYVCRKLNVAEKDYFGLRFVDGHKQRHWMDLGKSITKQLKEMTPIIVCFRFKFYPGDPILLKEEVTKYQLVLQLRRDLLHGRLYSNLQDMALLGGYIVQSELGDYNPEVHIGNYVAEYELIARQSADFEQRVKEQHEKLVGTTPAEADLLFLKKAVTLDTYGIDPHPVTAHGPGPSATTGTTGVGVGAGNEQLFIGINHTGISTFTGSKKSSHFKWNQISKLNYEAKMFIVHLSIPEDSRTKKKETFGFKCQSSSACKHLWRCAVEQRLFFNCGSATEIGSVRGGGLFGSKFKYSGKVLKEILEDPGPLRGADGVIQRTPLYRSLQRNKVRSSSDSPLRGYSVSTLPRSNHSAPPTGGAGAAHLDLATGTGISSSGSLPMSMSTLSGGSGTYCPEQTLPLLPLTMLETLEEDSPRAEEKAKKIWVVEVNGEGDGEGEESTSWVFEEGGGAGVGAENRDTNSGPVAAPENSEIPKKALAPVNTQNNCKPTNPTSESKKSLVVGFRLPSIGEEESQSITEKPLAELPQNQRYAEAEPNNNNTSSFVDADADSSKKSLPFRKFGVSMAPDPLLVISADAELPKLNSNSYIDKPASETSGGSGDDDISGARGTKIPKVRTAPTTTAPGYSTTRFPPGPGGPSATGLSIWKIFLVSMICVLVALVVVAIISIELDTEICMKIRRIPEIELFQAEVYDPFKGFLSTTLRFPFK